ncbi:hypothetical protein BC332_31725 [Capsicum chinense]|nr:hypothetical protein BC332_31725 [Capsicum chinense]
MNMDKIPKNIYSDSNPFASNPTTTSIVTTVAIINFVAVATGGGGGGDIVPSKTVDEVRIDIVAGVLRNTRKASEAVVELFKSCIIQ